MQLKIALLQLAIGASVLVQAVKLVPVPNEAPYTHANIEGLYKTPNQIQNDTVIQMLDVLDKYGLTKDFGIYSLHEHLNFEDGQVLYQLDRGDDIITKIYNYSSVRKTSVPYKYRLSFNGKETELLPVEVGAITDGIQDARRALAKAVNAGVLKDLATVLVNTKAQDIAGISYIRDFDRKALLSGQVVGTQVSEDHTEMTAVIRPFESFDPLVAHSFFTRNVASAANGTFEIAGNCSGDGEDCHMTG